MKLLVFSDLHLHDWKQFGLDQKTGLSKRLIEQQSILNQIITLIQVRNVSGVIFPGDLFHNVGSVATEVLNTAYTFFRYLEKNNIPVYFVKGNHDLVNRKSPKWFHYSGKIFDTDKKLEGLRLVDFNEEVDYEKIKGYKIVAIHQTPINSKVGNFEFKEGVNWKELAKNNGLVLFGHIHTRQHLSDNCIVVGSPMALNFGDVNDRGCYIIDYDTLKYDFVKLEYPEFKTVKTIGEVKEDGNYYRVLDAVPSKDIRENVIVTVNPSNFKERIKSSGFRDILNEWLETNNKPLTYLDSIKDLITDERINSINNKIFKGRISDVKIQNFGSIRDISYNISNGFVLVTGSNDVFDSNGSGKSTLFDAIYWCLFGKTTKGITGNDVIRRGEKNCSVTLKLIDYSGKMVEYSVKRSRKEGLSIDMEDRASLFIKNLTEGLLQDERQNILDNILGFDANLFLSSCYFSQENILMLTGLSSTEKTNLITNILGFESYDDLYSRISPKIKNLEQIKENECINEISRINYNIKQNESNIEIFRRQLTENIEGVVSSKKIIEEYKTKIKETKPLKEEIFKEIDYASLISNHEVEEAELISTIKNNQSILDNIKDNKHLLLNDYTKANTEKTLVDKEIKELEDKIELLKKSPLDTQCDKCGAKVTQENIYSLIEEKGIKLANLVEVSLSLEKQKTSLENQINGMGQEIDKLNLSQKEANSSLEKCKSMIKELNATKSQQAEKIRLLEKEKEKQLSDIKEFTNIIKAYEERISEFETKNISVGNEIKELEEKNKTQLKAIEDINLKIKELEEKIKILEFWKNTFSSNGIKPLLLDKFCNDFNKITNGYLTDISAGKLSFIFSPTSTTKAGEERNSIDIKVILDNSEVKYQSLSGGEKRRVDSALCFGLNGYITTMKGLSEHGLLGMIILDEVFSGLDKTGEENLALLLSKEGKNKFVAVIDHALDLGSYADKIWVVNKQKGVTSLTVNGG